MAVLPVPPYVPLVSYTPALGGEAWAVRQALAVCAGVEYDAQIWLCDASGTIDVTDLTPYLTKQGSTVTHDSTADVCSSASFSLGCDLQWGSDIVSVYQLIRSPQYQAGQWQRFPLGHFVVTTPQVDLLVGSARAVLGFDLMYLFQNDLSDSFVASAGTTYAANVLSLFVLAGVADNTDLLSEWATYSGVWAAKTLPVDMPYLLGSTYTYLQVVNELLKASGTRPLYTNPNGRYIIEDIPVPASQPNRGVFAKTDTAYGAASAASVVSRVNCSIKRDVWNVPNQWIFVQQGLSFQPTGTDGSNGRYVVNNLTQGPASQNAVGRILTSTQFLNASGSADLTAQGDAIVTALLSTGETLALQTASWPCAGHYDVFQYTDASLPDTNIRKVQAQRWDVSLDGTDTKWQANVVAAS